LASSRQISCFYQSCSNLASSPAVSAGELSQHPRSSAASENQSRVILPLFPAEFRDIVGEHDRSVDHLRRRVSLNHVNDHTITRNGLSAAAHIPLSAVWRTWPDLLLARPGHE
jgi:hypothetical protein